MREPIYKSRRVGPAAAEFDRDFPQREKIVGTPTQKRFEAVVVMRRRAD